MPEPSPTSQMPAAELASLLDFVSSAEIGLHWVGADGTILWANPADHEPLGYTAEEYIGHEISEFHVDPEAIRDILARLRAGERLREYEARLRCKDGSIRTVRITSSALFDEQGRFVHTRCFTRDVSGVKAAEDALRFQADELQVITDSLPALIAHIGPDLRYRLVNASYTRWFGLQREELVGRHLTDIVGEAAVATLRPHIDVALAGQPARFEAWVPYRAAGRRYVRTSYIPKRDAGGFLDGYIALVEDLTPHELAYERARVMAEASDVLSSSLDYEATLAALAGLLVPRLADWCAVEMLAEDGASQQLAIAHVDPDKVAIAQTVRMPFRPDPDATAGISHVLRTGQAELVEEISDEFLERHARGPEHLQILRELGLRSSLIVPIALRGRTLGALTLVTAESQRRYGPADLEVAQAIADRAALAIENARLFTEAQEATRRKDEFLAMLGHELRNPLAPILTALELMKLKGDAQFTAERDVIARQVQHLVRLVDDLLDISRITQGKVELDKKPIEISAVLASAIELVSPLLEQKRHRLAVNVPRRGLVVEADPVRLAQVFANVLTNAAKYTAPGGDVQIRADKSDGWAKVEIQDNGMGIAPQVLGRIFELFVQGPQALDRSVGGLGVGLRLARSLIEMQGGRISAHSAGPGQGSVFTISLPLVSAIAAAQVPASGTGTVQPTRNGLERSLLLVDDNPDAVQTLAEALRTAGHVVRVAADGPSALEQVRAQCPDIALLDIGLPVMDGYELARRMREECGERVRLFAITGYGLESDRRRSRAAGFERHFVKPLDFHALLRVIALERSPEAGGAAD